MFRTLLEETVLATSAPKIPILEIPGDDEKSVYSNLKKYFETPEPFNPTHIPKDKVEAKRTEHDAEIEKYNITQKEFKKFLKDKESFIKKLNYSIGTNELNIEKSQAVAVVEFIISQEKIRKFIINMSKNLSLKLNKIVSDEILLPALIENLPDDKEFLNAVKHKMDSLKDALNTIYGGQESTKYSLLLLQAISFKVEELAMSAIGEDIKNYKNVLQNKIAALAGMNSSHPNIEEQITKLIKELKSYQNKYKDKNQFLYPANIDYVNINELLTAKINILQTKILQIKKNILTLRSEELTKFVMQRNELLQLKKILETRVYFMTTEGNVLRTLLQPASFIKFQERLIKAINLDVIENTENTKLSELRMNCEPFVKAASIMTHENTNYINRGAIIAPHSSLLLCLKQYQAISEMEKSIRSASPLEAKQKACADIFYKNLSTLQKSSGGLKEIFEKIWESIKSFKTGKKLHDIWETPGEKFSKNANRLFREYKPKVEKSKAAAVIDHLLFTLPTRS